MSSNFDQRQWIFSKKYTDKKTKDKVDNEDFNNHNERHEHEGDDEINLDGLQGESAELATHKEEFNNHSNRHESGGDDEINITGLQGESEELASHKEESVPHQDAEKLQANSTDDVTSVTNAPIKSAGGLAVAKSTFIGGQRLNMPSSDLLNFSADNIGSLETGKQLRIRLARQGGGQSGVLRYTAGAYGSVTNNMHIADRDMYINTGPNTMFGEPYIDKYFSIWNTEELTLSHVGSGSVDIVLKHPDSHDDTMSEWGVTIETRGYNSRWTVVETVIEDIT